MLTLFKSIVRSRLEFCSEVWHPHLTKDIVLIEQVQRSFTNRICGVHELNYWERLETLNLMSLQRRREMIILTHVWKIKNNFFPNSTNISFKYHLRSNAMKSVLKPLPKVQGKLLTKYEESFLVKSSKLWNILPGSLTLLSDLNSFKNQLRIFLNKIPDKPPIPGYPYINNNSLTEQCLLKF